MTDLLLNDVPRDPSPLTSLIDGIEIDWDDRVLRPRPWTRLQAQWAIELHPALPPGPMLELCTGVGHIGMWAIRGTGRSGVLVDADEVACRHARRNAQRAGLSRAVRVVQHRIDGTPVPDAPSRLPLVLADPPYLPSASISAQCPDPLGAVDGGDDGLELVGVVLRTAAAHLQPGGACLLQLHGARQAGAVTARLAREWADIGLTPAAVREVDADRAVQLLHRTVD